MLPQMKAKVIAASVVLALIATVTGRARAVGGPKIEAGRFAIENGVFNTIFAKELCSCQFVDGLTLDDCKARDNLPAISHVLVDITVDPTATTVSSGYKGRETINRFTRSIGIPDVKIGGGATARYDEAHPEFGCVLTKLPSDRWLAFFADSCALAASVK